MKVAVQRLAPDLPLPAYATAGSAGLDLIAAVESEVVLPPGGFAAIPTGIALALPEGYEAQVRPRSGLAVRSWRHRAECAGHRRFRTIAARSRSFLSITASSGFPSSRGHENRADS